LPLKKTPDIIKGILKEKESEFSFFNIYFQDESRFGLMTKNGRSLTTKGVKPICPFLQAFQNLWLFGAFSPVNGEHFLMELPTCNSDNFQIFLDQFAALNPKEFKIIFLDNGAFHKAKKLDIPNNITLVFIPPYSPELNPAEKIWAFFKRQFTNVICKNLDEVSKFIDITAKKLSVERVVGTCRYEYIDVDIFNQI
jgi:transposase